LVFTVEGFRITLYRDYTLQMGIPLAVTMYPKEAGARYSYKHLNVAG
jgi:hypothetical protein